MDVVERERGRIYEFCMIWDFGSVVFRFFLYFILSFVYILDDEFFCFMIFGVVYFSGVFGG